MGVKAHENNKLNVFLCVGEFGRDREAIFSQPRVHWLAFFTSHVNVGAMRKHINESEFNKLFLAAARTRHATRNQLLLLLMFRHGLRATEASRLMCSDVDREAGSLYIGRIKRGMSTVHPLAPDEMSLFTAWLAEGEVQHDEPIFVTERRTRMSRQQIHYVVRRCGELAGLPIATHPHQLRHGCGYALANRGVDTRLLQDYLGHRCISSTVIYTATNHERFQTIWAATVRIGSPGLSWMQSG